MHLDDWRHSASCKGQDPELWHTGDPKKQKALQAICDECDVKAPCLEFAFNEGIRYGVWGGLTPSQRVRIRPRLIVCRCSVCGDRFEARNIRAAYCSKSCQAIVSRRREAKRRVARTLERQSLAS
jgi:WhiB family redox-sensing transcriptional regulator